MAHIRRYRSNPDIWPGYVDALATLLVVIIFLLMIFVLGQVFLNDALSGRDKAVDKLNGQVAQLADMLKMERIANYDLRDEFENISFELKGSLAKQDDMNSMIASLKSNETALNQKLIIATDSNNDINEKLVKSTEDLKLRLVAAAKLQHQIAALQALKLELANQLKNSEIARAGKSRDLNASRDETLQAQAEASLLNQQLKAFGQQISELNNLLDVSATRDKKSNARISALGKKLNTALASKVQELAKYRSDFFGQLRKILGSRQDIQIVKDRFVFQSEVLFASAEADLGDSGKMQLAKLAASLLAISKNIPSDIKWVLQVEGHTDSNAIHTPKFPSNWELSSARATSVVKFLITAGIPANRLAATGYGEFQPLDNRNDEIANRRNRRIELKLSQR